MRKCSEECILCCDCCTHLSAKKTNRKDVYGVARNIEICTLHNDKEYNDKVFGAVTAKIFIALGALDADLVICTKGKVHVTKCLDFLRPKYKFNAIVEET